MLELMDVYSIWPKADTEKFKNWICLKEYKSNSGKNQISQVFFQLLYFNENNAHRQLNVVVGS